MKIQARNCPGAAFLTGVKSDTYAIEITPCRGGDGDRVEWHVVADSLAVAQDVGQCLKSYIRGYIRKMPEHMTEARFFRKLRSDRALRDRMLDAAVGNYYVHQTEAGA